MKKYLTFILCVLFVLCFSAGAFAIHAEIPSETQAIVAKSSTQITIGGELRIRGEIQNNTSDFNSTIGDNRAYYDERVRLNVEAKVSPNTTGYVQMEAGNATNAQTYVWGTDSTGAKGTYALGETKRGSFNLNEAWILHKGSGLLGMSSGIKVGHMPVMLGNGLFFKHALYGDDGIILFADPNKDLHASLLTLKLKEGNGPTATSATRTGDANDYVALVNYKLGNTVNLSGDISYIDDQYYTATSKSHLWNFGLRGDANVSGVGLKADVEVQSGSVKSSTADTKYRGYAFLAGADYTISNIKLAAEYAYGSGDKSETTDKNEGFVTMLDQLQHYTYVYEYRTNSAGGSGTSTGTGISNTQYLKAGASSALLKDLTCGLDLYWLRANRVSAGKSKSIGTEIDVNAKYKIDRNLVYFVEGGYLVAGSYYDTAAKSSDNAYAIRHGVTLSF